MPKSKTIYGLFLVLLYALPAFAFNGEKITEGPLTLAISPISDVTNREETITATVTLSNSNASVLPVHLELKGLVDGSHVTGQNTKNLNVPANNKAEVQFQFVMGQNTYSAHYPAHVYAEFQTSNIPVTAHAVQIFQCDFPETPGVDSKTFSTVTVPAIGALTLYSVKTQRVTWKYFDKPEVHMPIGWQGSDTQSGANFGKSSTARGETKPAFTMHPPYRGGVGTVFADYRLQLPKTTPLKLIFFNAIRDNSAKEPKSDGVTFRVWANDQVLYEKHTDSKVWVPGEADLNKFSGQEILLRLESHPGPKKNTVCDSCFWGEPTILAGQPPKVLLATERQQLIETARQTVLKGKASSPSSRLFKLKGGAKAALVLGQNGLMDGALAFGADGKAVVYDGLNVSLFEHRVGAWPSGVIVENVRLQETSGKLRIVHQLVMENKKFELVAEVWTQDTGLRLKISVPERITDISLNRADLKAQRVYYGHGYAIVDPGAFRASGGGHNMATSHVGMDFENGLSLLMACDTPPDSFNVDPATCHYSLHTHPDTMLTFVPGTKGIFDCAIKYRPLYDKQASGGVAVKAGRFVLDYWGGKYADDTILVKELWQYGVTNTLLLMHAWQRWGYDYRLPDIYPPMPSLGTLEDMQGLSRFCNEHGIRWGLHDNYIDIYPDATDFSYDHVTFTDKGRPRRAWLNEGRDAQSYQFRPDHIMPFVKRNLALIKPNLQPTANFVDVFTSANSFDFYDREGKFHSRLETRKYWGECFSTIRDTLGNNAPTTSEAGSDHLIGYLDGADCQFLELSSRSRRFHNMLTCQDWERVPWFDAVNHTRFSLHGVGYSGRYQGDRSRFQHGIESDDYLSAEILTGHALMVDLPSGLSGAVRKYWLAQEFIESIAFDEISGTKFADGNVHHLIVRWKSGTVVYVNRGQGDWIIAGHTLPQYGYYARNGVVESTIERINGGVVEWSHGHNGTYVNGRGFHQDPPLDICPSAEKIEYLGERSFKLFANWEIREPLSKNLNVSYSFTRPRPGRYTEYTFSGGGKPAKVTSQWQGHVTTGDSWKINIPPDFPVGTYEISVGLYEPGKGRSGRYRMLGDEDSEKRYRIGNLIVEGNNTNITGISLEKLPSVNTDLALNEYNKTKTDFGTVSTKGAFRYQIMNRKLLLTPLPHTEAFQINLQLEKILGRPARIDSVEAVDPEGRNLRQVDFKLDGKVLVFTTAKEEFAYRINFQYFSFIQRLLNKLSF
ncbi:MAG: DUF5696 domain-containing protein [Kiritimatiellae bacterium]|nr:DUF5696 domain-containing protein [Kiritimatiellia bacterium]